MKCCNQNCGQGRTCPSKSDPALRSKVWRRILVAYVLALLAYFIKELV